MERTGLRGCLVGLLALLASAPAFAGHHEAPEACLQPERTAITAEERGWAQGAADSAAARKKIPIVIMPLVVSRSWPAGLRAPGDGPHPKFLYRWVDRDLKAVADPKDLSKVWAVHIDVPLSALAGRYQVFHAALSDILKFHGNNRSIELVLPGWFPKELRDALIKDRAALPRLLTRHLVSTACLEALAAQKRPGSDGLAFDLIRKGKDRDWARILADIFWRDVLRPPKGLSGSRVKWWAAPFLSVGADDPGTREIAWLASDDSNLRAAAALLLGEASYRRGLTADFARQWIARLLPLLDNASLRVRRDTLVAIARLAGVAKIPLDTFGIAFGKDPVAEALLEATLYCGKMEARTRVRPCQGLVAILKAQPEIAARWLSARIGANRTVHLWRKTGWIVDDMVRRIKSGKLTLSPGIRHLLDRYGLRIWGTRKLVAEALNSVGATPENPLDRGYYFFALKDYQQARAAFTRSGGAIEADLTGPRDLQVLAMNAILATGFEPGVRLGADLIRKTQLERIARMGAFSKHKPIRKAADQWARKRGKRWTVVEVPRFGIPGIGKKTKKAK